MVICYKIIAAINNSSSYGCFLSRTRTTAHNYTGPN